jgi:hypothetical protein
MPQNYSVEYAPIGGSFTALTNVQEIAVSIGRQRQLNAYGASTATVTLRYPTGFATPITDLVSGNLATIKNLTTSQAIFRGVINNVDVSYGIPYAGGVGQADFLTFTIEGSFARFGRAQGENYAMAAGTLFDQINDATTETDLQLIVSSELVAVDMPATTISSTWGDWLNKVLVTVNGRLHDAELSTELTLVSPFNVEVTTVNFSDTANNSTNQVYDQINFGSYADNFYTQVIVDPENFAAATVQTGVAPFRTLLTNTLNASTAQATDFANYLLANYDEQGQALLSISCLAEAQADFKLDKLSSVKELPNYPGAQVNVTFRGTVFTCIIEGVSMTATPESSRYTFYLSGADLNAYLILNNTVFGRLDNNRLGY